MESDDNPEFNEQDLKQQEDNNNDEQDIPIDGDENGDNNYLDIDLDNDKENEKEPDEEEKNQEPEPDQDQDLDQDSDDSDDSITDKRFPEVERKDWIHWFCRLKGNEYFVEVEEDFIKNSENLAGINYEKYLKVFLSERPKNAELTRELLGDLQEIREVYGLIHKRFIFTQIGMGKMREKFLDGAFGFCPRMLCNKQVMLPVGLSEDMRYSQVKAFCPSCQEVYKPREHLYGYDGTKRICKFDLPDGIYFGTSFPQAFLINFPDLDPKVINSKRYIPKLYGFRIFGKYGSKYYTDDKEKMKENLVKYGVKKN